MYRESAPNPDRPLYWEGEETHFRAAFNVGDIVRVSSGSGYLCQITCWNNTHSHVKAGRLVYLEPLLAYPGTEVTELDKRFPYASSGAWESDLEPAEPGDVAAHLYFPDGKPGRYDNVSASWSR